MCKSKKIIVLVISIVLISILSISVAGYIYVNNTLKKAREIEINTKNENIGIKEEVKNSMRDYIFNDK